MTHITGPNINGDITDIREPRGVFATVRFSANHPNDFVRATYRPKGRVTLLPNASPRLRDAGEVTEEIIRMEDNTRETFYTGRWLTADRIATLEWAKYEILGNGSLPTWIEKTIDDLISELKGLK